MIDDILPPEQAAKTKTPKMSTPGAPELENQDDPIDLDELDSKNLEIEDKHDAKNTKVPNKRLSKLKFWKIWHNWSKKRKIITIVAAVLFVAGTAGGAFALFHSSPPPPKPVAKVAPLPPPPPPKPTTLASPLTGVQVAPDLAARPVTGIMIENSPDARPQSGIQDAGVVFEAIAEGGITRFLTLYQDSQPQYIGPVRSVRPYYLDWVAPFDAGIAHVGGSPEALAQVRGGMKDLDQFFNAGSYQRVSSRYAPHNVYTSFAWMDALNKSKGYNSSKFTSWPRKTDEPLKVPTAKSIDINIDGALYNSHYDYDTASNSYLRSEGGKPHVAVVSADDRTGIQLHPKVILTLVMPYSVIDSAGHSGYATNGSGAVTIFQDGGSTQGTWSKASRGAQFEFKDAAGAPIKLNTGQTWLVMAANPAMVVARP